MLERDIQARITLALSQAGARVFRNNSAKAWVGQATRASQVQTVTLQPGDVVIRKARRLHAGLGKGSPDLIGWTPGGVFLGVECKPQTGRATPEQRNWIEAINRGGGRAGIARSPEDALKILTG